MKPNSVYLEHILQEIEFIVKNTSAISYIDFLQNEVLKKAVLRSFEVIGEAANQISDEFQLQHPDIAWRGMTGLRNRLIHQYFDVDFAMMWEIIERDVPVLHEQILEILKEKNL